jgi:hypothetical protein
MVDRPNAKGRTERRVDVANLGRVPQMSAHVGGAPVGAQRVMPNGSAKWGNGTIGEEQTTALRSACSGNLNVSNRRMRTRMSGGVGGK